MTSESQNKKIDWLGGIDWEQFFGTNGSLGGADLLFAGAEHLAERIGELLFVLLTCLRDESGNPAYRDIFVILPPDADGARCDVVQHLGDTMLGIRGTNLDQRELKVVSRRVQITCMSDLHISTVLTHVKSMPERSFVLIVESSRYRTPNLLNKNASFTTMRLDEDLWIPYLQNLTIACADLAQRNDLCVLIDVGQFSPLRESNYNMLHSIEPCSITIAENENYDLNRKLAFILSDWDKQIQAGQIDKVLEHIDELPADLDTQKLILKVQVLHKSGENLKAAKLIDSDLVLNNHFDAQLRVRLASIADAGEAPELAKKLLDGAIANLSSQEFLDLALTLCRNLSLSDLETECIVRLERLYPSSSALHDHRVIRLFQACQSTAQCEPIHIFRGNTDFGAFANRLLVELQIKIDPDYQLILEELGRHWPEFSSEARLCSAVNAKERKLSTQVLMLAKPSELSGDFARITVQFLIWAIESCLLGRNEINCEEKVLVEAIKEIIRYTALNPEDQRTRSDLSRLMSVQVAASAGIGLLAIAVLELFQTTPELLDNVVKDNIEVTNEDFLRFFKSAIEWCPASTILSGLTTITLAGFS